MSDAESMKIPEAAVEAAARTMSPLAWGPSVWQLAAHGETPTAARDRAQQESLEQARVALEAAAPYMRQAFFLEMNLRAVEAELKTPFR